MKSERNYQVNHPTSINYQNGLDGLAEDLGNLRYDALASFLNKLSEKVTKDAKADQNRERYQLAKQLNYAAKHINNSWKICKIHM